MNEKYKRLKEPLTAQDIELRVGTVGEKGVTLLLYKTARVDLKRLDDVFNFGWQRQHYVDAKGNVVCKVSIYDTELKEWISREDVGTESNTEKEKGAYSDSFKRAGSSWGIGVELYNAPLIFIKCETVGKGDKNQWGKYKYYELKEKYYFSNAVVTKFDVINSDVFVEIKNKNDVLFSNFKNNVEQKQVIKTKEDAKAVVEKIQMDFEKIKSKIIDSENIQDFESAKSEANKFLTQMNDSQKNEIRNIVQNKKSILNNSNENTITPTNIGA
jgi:hypothetical protein